MIVGGVLVVAPVFGPLGKTLLYLDDFFADRPQSMAGPDFSFFAELLTLLLCPLGLILFVVSMIFFFRSGRQPISSA